ncbi:MAG: hypothetical protein HUJ53_10650 [Holdemanella sp.]|nr:hypothetical protein [Holdemanella sp.]
MNKLNNYYYASRKDCMTLYQDLAKKGYRWHISTFVDEGILENMDNPLNIAEEHNLICIDRKNRFVFTSDWIRKGKASAKAMRRVIAEHAGIQEYFQDETEYGKMLEIISNMKEAFITEGYSTLDESLSEIMDLYGLDKASRENLYEVLADTYEYLFLAAGILVKEDHEPLPVILLKSFKRWVSENAVDVRQYRLYEIRF